MKAIRKLEKGVGAEYVDLPTPEIAADEVLVKVEATALCKSDVDVYNWTPVVQGLTLPLPITMGHEFMGEVVETGAYVKGLTAGDRVVGETHIPCNHCHVCLAGHPHICANNMGVIGRNIDGSFAEYIKIPEIAAIKMDLPAEQGAVMEPMATALHGLTKGEVSGKTIAVLGCGTIGLMSIELAKIMGAAKVIALSTTDEKLAKASQLGADRVVNGKTEDLVEVIMEETKGQGVDLALEYTGSQTVINQMILSMRTAGTCVMIGMIDKPLTLENYMLKAVYKELVITGIFGRRIYQTWELLKAILETGRIDVSQYVCDTFALADFEKAIKASKSVPGRIILKP